MMRKAQQYGNKEAINGSALTGVNDQIRDKWKRKLKRQLTTSESSGNVH